MFTAHLAGKIVVFAVGKDGVPRARLTQSSTALQAALDVGGTGSDTATATDTDRGTGDDDDSAGLALTAPLTVLVNGNTASAAEVLAAALKASRLALCAYCLIAILAVCRLSPI